MITGNQWTLRSCRCDNYKSRLKSIHWYHTNLALFNCQRKAELMTKNIIHISPTFLPVQISPSCTDAEKLQLKCIDTNWKGYHDTEEQAEDILKSRHSESKKRFPDTFVITFKPWTLLLWTCTWQQHRLFQDKSSILPQLTTIKNTRQGTYCIHHHSAGKGI